MKGPRLALLIAVFGALVFCLAGKFPSPGDHSTSTEPPDQPQPARRKASIRNDSASILTVATDKTKHEPRDFIKKSAEMEILREAFANAVNDENPERREQLLVNLCFRWAEFDPAGAVRLAFEHHVETLPGVAENLTTRWAESDLPAARAWAEEQPSGDLRSTMIERIGFLLARRDPEAAACYVLREIPPGACQEEAAITILRLWAIEDPAAAEHWAEQFPPGSLRARALNEVLGADGYGAESRIVSEGAYADGAATPGD